MQQVSQQYEMYDQSSYHGTRFNVQLHKTADQKYILEVVSYVENRLYGSWLVSLGRVGPNVPPQPEARMIEESREPATPRRREMET